MPVVVAPSYNNAGTVCSVLDRVLALDLPLIVVNDGSTDPTAGLLAEWVRRHPGAPVRVLTHPVNRGRAMALRTAFAEAGRLGYTHAATIDTDARLDPEQIPALLEAARREPDALVLGWRDERSGDYPSQRRMGRRFGNLGIRMECGLRVRDSQCGLRVYPLRLVNDVRCRAGRFGYESEIITRAVWAGFAIVEQQVHCHYPPDRQRVSHYGLWRDTLRMLGTHGRLMGRALIPWPHRKLVRRVPVAARTRRSWRSWLEWLSPAALWRQIRHDTEDRMNIAAAVSIGAFIGCLPAMGYQTLLSLYAARRLHLHPVATVLGSYVSVPPIGQAIWVASLWLGHLLHAGQIMVLRDLDPSHLTWRTAGGMLVEWLIGGALIGVVLMPAAFLVTLGALGLVRPRFEAGKS